MKQNKLMSGSLEVAEMLLVIGGFPKSNFKKRKKSGVYVSVLSIVYKHLVNDTLSCI